MVVASFFVRDPRLLNESPRLTTTPVLVVKLRTRQISSSSSPSAASSSSDGGRVEEKVLPLDDDPLGVDEAGVGRRLARLCERFLAADDEDLPPADPEEEEEERDFQGVTLRFIITSIDERWVFFFRFLQIQS